MSMNNFKTISPEEINDNPLSDELHDIYTLKDYHRMYIGEIVKCWSKK